MAWGSCREPHQPTALIQSKSPLPTPAERPHKPSPWSVTLRYRSLLPAPSTCHWRLPRVSLFVRPAIRLPNLLCSRELASLQCAPCPCLCSRLESHLRTTEMGRQP